VKKGRRLYWRGARDALILDEEELTGPGREKRFPGK